MKETNRPRISRIRGTRERWKIEGFEVFGLRAREGLTDPRYRVNQRGGWFDKKQRRGGKEK